MQAEMTMDLPVLEDVYEMTDLTDAYLDELLDLQDAEIENMQIADSDDLADLKMMLSDDALSDLDALTFELAS